MLLAEIIGEEIVQDELPFDGAELVHRLKTRGGNRDNRVAAYNVSELDLVPDPSRNPRSGGNHSPARKPPSNPPPARPSGFIPVGRPSSPSVPATRSSAPSARAHTLWATALTSCPNGAGTDRIGQLLSAPLRDSVAQLVLRGTIALEPASADRLALLRDRNMDRPLSLVIAAAGACLGAALYRVLVGSALPQKEALEIVEIASREALGSDAADADMLGRYMSSEAPLKDLSRRAAAALGSSDDAAHIFEALAAYAEVLRADLGEVVRQVQRIRS